MPSPPLPRRRWSAAAHAGLTDLIGRGGSHRVAALDWDETAIRGDISYALLDDLDGSTDEDLWGHYRALIARDRLEAYKSLARLLLHGRTRDEVHTWTRTVAEAAVAAGRLAWVPEIADLVAALHATGWEVWVVTGSPTEVVGVLAPRYGVPSDRVIGMDAPTDDGGRYCNELIEPVTWRDGKPALLERRTGRAPDLAMGDSEGDIRLLAAATAAVWIDRGDPELAAEAAKHGWWRQEGWE